ncbi:MAG: formyltransferase family protein [Alphaproteobacteria bacterium]|jgi:methionyl-tRNA formyltransferase|nr:formyltransferase family protein [Alphaproteobacteria bacterium]|tara:strand:+ start:684 stop:1394 length:711 start_codon:yes stop_codon:yes gene_type:complete
MRLVVLTTGSVRRRYFVKALQNVFPVTQVFIETGELTPPFETAHPLDDACRNHENEVWFAGAAPDFDHVAEVERFESLNDSKCVEAIAATKPNVVLVFGAGLLRPPVLDICPNGCVNLHSGDPESYRGLDCHLWAVYHGDFAALVTSLHRIAPEIDAGDVVAKRPVTLAPGMSLHELRRAHTEGCVEVVTGALTDFAATGAFQATPQNRRGRYYSFMPAAIKDQCIRRFERHTATL